MNEGLSHSITWRRLDHPATEVATLEWQPGDDSWIVLGRVHGTLDGARRYDLRYHVRCDASWATRDALVEGELGGDDVYITIERESNDEWRRDGAPVANLAACTDVDLGFSPITNTLPIRRLGLGVGEQATVRAAWLRFPELRLEVLEQVYRRVSHDHYVYESGGGRFRADLTVDASGLVRRYGEYWVAEGAT